jgi:DNA-binding beta-propeller fold protein YncE
VSLGSPIVPVALEAQGLDFFYGVDNTGIDIIATNSAQTSFATAPCPQTTTLAHNATVPPTPPTYYFPPTHISLGHGTFQPINFFVSPDSNQLYIVTRDQGVLVYSFNTGSTSAIPLVGNGNPAPLAADITVDGTLLYVAGTDGQLHELNLQTGLDVMEIPFPQLPNSSNSFCFQSYSCSLNIVAIKP